VLLVLQQQAVQHQQAVQAPLLQLQLLLQALQLQQQQHPQLLQPAPHQQLLEPARQQPLEPPLRLGLVAAMQLPAVVMWR
jgi:hypothetical protein